MRDISKKKGEVLSGQSKIEEETYKRLDEHFSDDRSRDYVDATLNNPQGKASSKAANEKVLLDPTINFNSFLKEMSEIFKADIALRDRYGKGEAKLRTTKGLTKLEKEKLSNDYMKQLIYSLLKEGNLSELNKKTAKKVMKLLKEKKFIIPKNLDEQSDILFKTQKVEVKTPTKHENEMTLRWTARKERETGAFPHMKKLNDKMPENQEMKLVLDTIKAKLDRFEFLKAIKEIESKKVKGFDYNNISREDKKNFPKESTIIENYINRVHDLNQVKREKNPLGTLELKQRELYRVKDEHSKMGLQDGEFTQEEFNKIVESQLKDYTDLNLVSELKVKRKKKADEDFVPEEKSDKEIADELAILNKQRYEKSKAIDLLRNESLPMKERLARVTGKNNPRLGMYVLTDAQINDVLDFPNLTNAQILDKTMPQELDVIKANELKKKARYSFLFF